MNNYRVIDKDTWKRKMHFDYFIDCDEPFHGMNVMLDVTKTKEWCQQNNAKIFDRYMFHYLHAINASEELRIRILGDKIVVFEEIITGLTVMKADETFAYGSLYKMDEFSSFVNQMRDQKEIVKKRPTLHEEKRRMDMIHFSVIPWVHFTSLSHARRFGKEDTVPKITFGKIEEYHGKYKMPMSIHVHHALVDGKGVADFILDFQNRLNQDG